MLSQSSVSSCRRSAKGYFFRLRACVCEQLWSSIRQVHISPVSVLACSRTRAAARSLLNNFINVLSTLSADQQTRRVTFHEDAKPIATPQNGNITWKSLIQMLTCVYSTQADVCYLESRQNSSRQKSFGRDTTRHRRHKSYSSASWAFHTIQEYKTERLERKDLN